MKQIKVVEFFRGAKVEPHRRVENVPLNHHEHSQPPKHIDKKQAS
jgi:hypothetical protein